MGHPQDLPHGTGRLGARSTLTRRAAILALAVTAIACSGPVSTGQPVAQSPSMAHATGATDVVLRLDDVGGGLIEPTFSAIQPPTFTLYGDGTIILRDVSHDARPRPIGPSMAMAPFRIAKLSEAQIQALLAEALGDGGLGSARAEYLDPRSGNIPTVTFTINAAGIAKTVTITGLDENVTDGPDVLVRHAFARLARRLRGFDGDGVVKGQPYAPARYRGLLVEDSAPGPAVGALPWPWGDVMPSDFVIQPGAGDDPAHVLTDAQVKALRVNGYEGGFQGLGLFGPGGGKRYALELRPLLPDEKE